MLLKTKNFVLSLTLFLGNFLFLQAQANYQPLAKSLYWEVSGKKIKAPIYIFGTHHLHDYQFVIDNQGIQQTLEEVDMVVGEIIVDSTDYTIILKMMRAMMLEGQSLKDLLSEQEYKDTDACLKEYLGLGIGVFNKFKPIALYQIIMVGKYMEIMELPEEVPEVNGSMDAYFQSQAKDMGKQVGALETVEDQISALYDRYPMERQVEMLLDMVYDRDSLSTNQIVDLNALYKEQDIDGLLKVMEETSAEGELDFLLVERNKKWIPEIEKIINQKKSAFIAVGAGHLPGEFGIIHLLRQKGYTVEPIIIEVR